MGRTQSVLRTVFTVSILFLLLLGFSYPFIEPGTGAHVAAALTVVPLVLTLVMASVLTYAGSDVLDF